MFAGAPNSRLPRASLLPAPSAVPKQHTRSPRPVLCTLRAIWQRLPFN